MLNTSLSPFYLVIEAANSSLMQNLTFLVNQYLRTGAEGKQAIILEIGRQQIVLTGKEPLEDPREHT